MKYVVTDHDADIGFIIYGEDYGTLFNNALEAVFSLIVDPDSIESRVEMEVDVSGGDDLLIVFLNELLYLWDAKRFIPKAMNAVFSGEGLNARVSGEYFDENRHNIRQEVKAVTYHLFSVSNENGQYRATIIVDV